MSVKTIGVTNHVARLINALEKHKIFWKIVVGITMPAVYLVKTEVEIVHKIDKYLHEEHKLSIANSHNLYEALVKKSH